MGALRAKSAWRFSCREDLRRHSYRSRALLGARGRLGQDPGPVGDADRGHPARQAQAGVHPAHRHRLLRRDQQRPRSCGDREQARAEALLPPIRLPRRPAVAHTRRAARAAPGGGHPAGRPWHAAAQPAGPEADHQAQGVRRSGPPARGAEARTPGDRNVMTDDERPEEQTGETEPTTDEPAETPPETEAAASEGAAPPEEPERPAADAAPEEPPAGEQPAAEGQPAT